MLKGHGGEIYHLAQSLGIKPHLLQDHSSNVSPLPPPEGLYSHLEKHLKEIEYLPEVDSQSLREALAQYYGLLPEQFFPSSGTTEWIFTIPSLGPFRKALILGPTYGDYADALRLAGVDFSYFLAKEEDQFIPDLSSLKKALASHDLVFICNPNNPTGVYLSPQNLLDLINSFPQVTFVVDESYVDFHPKGKSLLFSRPFPANLIVLCSFSKIYRIPGLRLGFCASGQKWQEKIAQRLLPWAVNRLAQVAGLWLLKQKDYLQKVRSLIQKERKRLFPLFSSLPEAKLFPGEIHFFLLKHQRQPVQKIWQDLLERHHLLVREASNFYGLSPHFLRLALRSPQENDRLFQGLREVWS